MRWMCILLLLLDRSFGAPKKPLIPVGGIFDVNDDRNLRAWNKAMDEYNMNNSSLFKFDLRIAKVNVKKNMDLIKAICNITHDGVFALFGTAHPLIQEALQSYTSRLQMPYITQSFPYEGVTEGQFILNMKPQYSRASVDVMKNRQWSHLHYFYEDYAGLVRLQELCDAIQNHSDERYLGITMWQVDNVSHAIDVLVSIELEHIKQRHNIVIDVSSFSSDDVLNELHGYQSGQRHMKKFCFLTAGLDFLDLDLRRFHSSETNIIGLQLDKGLSNNYAFVSKNRRMQADQNSISTALSLAKDSVEILSRALYKVRMYRPILFDEVLGSGLFMNGETRGIPCDIVPQPWMYGRNIMNALKKESIPGLSGNVDFDENGYRQDYRLLEAEMKPPGLVKSNAHWHPKSGYHANIKEGAEMRLFEIENATTVRSIYVVTVKENRPYVFKKESSDGTPLVGNERWTGFCTELLKAISVRNFPFSYVIKTVADNNYGINCSGYWDGMVGEILNGEADLAIGDFTVTKEREEAILFSKPFMELGISIMLKKPESEEFNPFEFMDPLGYEVWICIVFAYLGVSVVIFLVGRFSSEEWKIVENTDGSVNWKNNLTIWNSLWFSIGAFMQQGCEINPKATSPRVAVSVWWLFTLILIASYTANLAAFLTVARMGSTIENAEDLAAQTKVKYGTIGSGTTKEFFRNSNIPTYERMWVSMSSNAKDVFVKSAGEGIKKVREENGGYAFIVDSTTIDYETHQEPCDTMKVGHLLNHQSFAIGMAYGSNLAERISIAILEMHEREDIQKLRKKWWEANSVCKEERSENTEGHALTLDKIHGIFIILCVGVTIAMVTLGLEVFWSNLKNADNSNKAAKDSTLTATDEKAALAKQIDQSLNLQSSVAVSSGHLVAVHKHASPTEGTSV